MLNNERFATFCKEYPFQAFDVRFGGKLSLGHFRSEQEAIERLGREGMKLVRSEVGVHSVRLYFENHNQD